MQQQEQKEEKSNHNSDSSEVGPHLEDPFLARILAGDIGLSDVDD